MKLLLDTSTPVCYLTLVDGDQTFDYEWQADRTLARYLLKFLQEKLTERGADFHDITAIGVMKGPGSFTGLRIGLSVANTLSDSLQIPIVGTNGDNWQEAALERLARGETDHIVLPEYGGEAHITRPRK